MTIRVEWHDDKVLKAVGRETEKVERRLAKLVQRTAEALAPRQTGKLKSEIDIRSSKFADGGYIVQAQGPGNYTRYYASFVELGTHKMAPQPYLRPAINKWQAIGHQMLKRVIS